jgi:hypothetical protein
MRSRSANRGQALGIGAAGGDQIVDQHAVAGALDLQLHRLGATLDRDRLQATRDGLAAAVPGAARAGPRRSVAPETDPGYRR